MIELCARTHNLDDIETILAQGFKVLEITLPCSGGLEEEHAWRELAKQRDLSLLAHGPNEGNPRDLTHLTDKHLPRLRQTLEEASRLDVAILTIHFNVDSRWIPPETIQGKIDLLNQIVGWGVELGVHVNLENLSEGAADLEKALLKVPHLDLTLDVGHAMLTHRTSTAPEIIRRLPDRISHLHLHDNHGGKSYRDDEHLIPGEGKVAFTELFRLLKQKGYNQTATLEVAPHEMALARKRVTEFWLNSS
ncbi:MAG: sugar phosphate isomerase/epimerase [Deltaproteobacteria bacterium]|nr:sugar phosphate isomerase/epimerase [Deltaproteobacteria bacterium]